MKSILSKGTVVIPKIELGRPAVFGAFASFSPISAILDSAAYSLEV